MKFRGRERGNEDFESKKMKENRMRSDKSLLINESVARLYRERAGRKEVERERTSQRL